MPKLTDSQRQMLEGKNLIHLATICKDGGPSVSPVWVDLEGDLIRINSAEGRLKVRNMRRDPRVGLSLVPEENAYRTLSIRGTVVEMTHEGADEHIDSLSQKYLGVTPYAFRTEGEQRVLIRIRPDIIAGMG